MTELRQKILLTRLDGQRSSLNGKQRKRKGLHVKTPSDDFKWNQLGELYQWFTDTYAYLSLQKLKDMLNDNINSIYAMIDSLSEEELFKPHMRKWADEATKDSCLGSHTSSYMLTQLLHSEHLELRLKMEKIKKEMFGGGRKRKRGGGREEGKIW